MKLITRLLTKNKTEIPLLYIMFNFEKYKTNGKPKSCECKIHPVIAGDEYIKESLNDIIDYIRDNYDMDKLV